LKFIPKIILFLIIFSLVFWLMRTIDHGRILLLDLRDLGGIPWLYSAICLMFSILAAFTIQKEWENWNHLVESIKGEVDALRELWLLSRHLSNDIKENILKCIKDYLYTIQGEWPAMEQWKRRESEEKTLDALRNEIAGLTEETGRMQLVPLFNDLLRNRNRRLYQSVIHIPHILKNTLIFADVLLIFLSLFIGVKNTWLDYIFTLSIGVLAYTIYIVIDDLDNPFRPGAWHLTPQDYKILLDDIKNKHTVN
jgi:hypothetical protein